MFSLLFLKKKKTKKTSPWSWESVGPLFIYEHLCAQRHTHTHTHTHIPTHMQITECKPVLESLPTGILIKWVRWRSSLCLCNMSLRKLFDIKEDFSLYFPLSVSLTHTNAHSSQSLPEDISKDFASFSKRFQRASLWIGRVWGKALEVWKITTKKLQNGCVALTHAHTHTHTHTHTLCDIAHTSIPHNYSFWDDT